ncbi:FtsX-like permease family protein [Paenibacillus sp. CN-4]|uniref:FtsX-like permease family protein n=1 Tax=Paenibacillus nanchangensis TaxID=3348343 RepID=UPI00397C3F33
MKTLHLAAAAFRSSRSAAFSLFILILLASLLLAAGLTVLSGTDAFYEDKVRELHEPHVSIAMNSGRYLPAYREFLVAQPGVKEIEQEQAVLLSTSTIPFYEDDSGFGIRSLVLNADAKRTIAPVKLIEQTPAGTDDGIYIPYSLKERSGYKLGDRFTITYRNERYSYRITGVYESILMGTPRLDLLKFYLPEQSYRQLSKAAGPGAQGTLLSVLMADSTQSRNLLMDYYKQFPASSETADPSFWAADTQTAEDSGTFVVSFLSLLLSAFAAVIGCVALIVVKFQITDNIEGGLANIGVLQAMGYTRLQIMCAYVVQYTLLAAAASAAGVAASYAVMPVYDNLISSLAGLIWSGGRRIQLDIACMVAVTLFVSITAFLSAARIRKLLPAAALRSGMSTHNFRRNWFPLERTIGHLQGVLAAKAMFANVRQNVLIAIILSAVTFVSIVPVVMYDNITGEQTAFFKMLGSETPDIGIQVQPGQDSLMLLSGIEQMNGVTKAAIWDSVTTVMDNQIVSTEISDRFDKLDNQTVYKGRYPQFDNEIAITGTLSKLLGKSVGDSIQVTAGNTSYPFLITGLNQTFSTGGKAASLTASGLHHLIPGNGTKGMSINVYLQGADKAAFTKEITRKYGDKIRSVTNVDESKERGTQVYHSAVSAVMAVILAISALVTVLVVYLVIKTAVLRKKKELGILKAAGYTTTQLVTQVTLSIMPLVVLGVVTGALLGSRYTNSLLELLLAEAGVSRVSFVVHTPLAAGICAAVVALSYLVSVLTAYRIRKITPYVLITE